MEVTQASGEPFLLHLEFQSTNDTTMSFRMLRYWLFIMQQYSQVLPEVRQYVIYVGKVPMEMNNTLSYDYLHYTYPLVDMRSVPAGPFLASDKPVEIIFAVLCAYQDKDLLVEQILQRLKETVVEELRLSKYIRQLEILSQLRNLQSTVHQKRAAMDMIYDIEQDPVYQEGIEYGEKRGEKKGQKSKAQAIAKAMKQAGEPTDKIVAYTQLSAAEIEKL